MNSDNDGLTVGPTGIPLAAAQWIDDLMIRIIVELFGRWPATDVEWERIAARLGLKVHYVEPCILNAPCMKYDYALQRGHVAIPSIAHRVQRCRWLFHEVIELLLGLEHYHPPIIYPVEWGSDHDLARAIEELHFGARPSMLDEPEKRDAS